MPCGARTTRDLLEQMSDQRKQHCSSKRSTLASSSKRARLAPLICPASSRELEGGTPGGGRGVSYFLLPPKPDEPLKKYLQCKDSAGSSGQAPERGFGYRSAMAEQADAYSWVKISDVWVCWGRLTIQNVVALYQSYKRMSRVWLSVASSSRYRHQRGCSEQRPERSQRR